MVVLDNACSRPTDRPTDRAARARGRLKELFGRRSASQLACLLFHSADKPTLFALLRSLPPSRSLELIRTPGAVASLSYSPYLRQGRRDSGGRCGGSCSTRRRSIPRLLILPSVQLENFWRCNHALNASINENCSWFAKTTGDDCVTKERRCHSHHILGIMRSTTSISWGDVSAPKRFLPRPH